MREAHPLKIKGYIVVYLDRTNEKEWKTRKFGIRATDINTALKLTWPGEPWKIWWFEQNNADQRRHNREFNKSCLAAEAAILFPDLFVQEQIASTLPKK